MYREIKRCRICGNTKLVSVINLGNQYLTGVFPRSINEQITSGPLEVIKCREDDSLGSCGLLQLRHSYDIDEMYGENYGYRSGLNKSMVNHLQEIVKKIQGSIELRRGDLILDIGSNDSTLLQAYPKNDLILAGIDPTGKKFEDFYPEHIKLIPDFFSSDIVKEHFGSKKAKVITSIAMFYDLESPVEFMRQIYDILADDGIWILEQSYMPMMLEMNAYDTICHEHLEYYGLKQIKWMTDRVGFKIIDVEMNHVNGGSFLVKVAKSDSLFREAAFPVQKILMQEHDRGLNSLKPYEDFKKRVYRHKEEFVRFIQEIKSKNKEILGYGASTKGNVILQFCNLTRNDIPFIAEVNQDKFGCYTPGTLIPIISEESAKAMRPDYFMVLPWHFMENILGKERDYLKSGGKLLFPLPSVQVF
jgi:NDP-4-keto-2,6-dideoxyhexose 3-C-methyltransferase